MTKNTIKDNVEALLKREDVIGVMSRNNDNFLTLAYILRYHQDLNLTLDSETTIRDLATWSSKLPALSEIKRIRAYFQNK